MPNGNFCFLLNYIDHGVKSLFSIPLTRKHASCIAVVLLEIFTVVGPPMILQSDNGNEFNTVAMTRKQVDEFCGKLVTSTGEAIVARVSDVYRSLHHSLSNGGVEQVNCTMQEKLGAWMKDCKSRQWMIGCCLMMWQYNTQNHCTIGDIPYSLVFCQLPRVGISALPLDASVLTQLATEAQLNCLCNYVGKVDVLDNETAVVEAIDDAEEDKTADCDKIQANTNNSNNHEYVAAVVNYNVNDSNAADDNLDEITVELLQTMDIEESGAQVGNFDQENIPLATVVMDDESSTPRKSNCLEEISRWHKRVNKLPNIVQIDLAYLRELKLRESVPVACWGLKDPVPQNLFPGLAPYLLPRDYTFPIDL
jgi:hypothetical protein